MIWINKGSSLRYRAGKKRVYLFWHLCRRNQRRAFLEKNQLSGRERASEREKEGKHIWHNISNQTRVRRRCYWWGAREARIKSAAGHAGAANHFSQPRARLSNRISRAPEVKRKCKIIQFDEKINLAHSYVGTLEISHFIKKKTWESSHFSSALFVSVPKPLLIDCLRAVLATLLTWLHSFFPFGMRIEKFLQFMADVFCYQYLPA